MESKFEKKKSGFLVLFIFFAVCIWVVIGILFAKGILDKNDLLSRNKIAYCDTDYILTDGKCKKIDMISANQKIAGYNCTANMTLNGNKCVLKQYTQAYATYDCPSPYRNRGNGTCYYSSSFGDSCPSGHSSYLGSCILTSIKATVTYRCFSGTLVGDQCETELIVDAIPNYIYDCPIGYTLENESVCTKTIIEEVKWR